MARNPLDNVPKSFCVAQQAQKDIGAAVHANDMEVFLVAYVSGFIARQVLSDISDAGINQCLHIFQGLQ
jgi:hypothetical protein